MLRKQNLASVLGIQKGTVYFSEIIKLQFGKKRHTLLCILLLFRIIVAWLPPIFFLDRDLLSPHSHKPHKNTKISSLIRVRSL